MVNNNFNFPLSFQALNEQLEDCKNSQEIGIKIEFKSLEVNNLSFAYFIKSILYPLESYSDFNKENLTIFYKRIQILFPLSTPENLKVLTIFWNKVNQKLKFPSGQEPSTLTYKGTIQTGSKETEKPIIILQKTP